MRTHKMPWLLGGLLILAVACSPKDPAPGEGSAAEGESEAESTETPTGTETEATADDSTEPEGTEPEGTEPEGSEPAAAEVVEEGPTPEMLQCEGLLTKSLETVVSILGVLQVEAPEGFEDRYRGAGNTYLERCSGLAQEARDCLEQAADPITGIASCDVNADLSSSERLRAVNFGDYVALFQTQPLAEGEAAPLLAGMVGTWQNVWESAHITTTWTLGADGTGTQTELRDNSEPESWDFSIDFAERFRIGVTRGTTRQNYIFYRNGDMFYTSSNQLYNVYPIADEAHFVVKYTREFVRHDEGTCQVFNEYGSAADTVECGFADQDGQRVFNLSYHHVGRDMPMGGPRIEEAVYFVFDGVLVDGRMQPYLPQ